MHDFYVMDGKKLIDFKPKHINYARAFHRRYEMIRTEQNRTELVLGGRICLGRQKTRFRICGTAPLKNQTLTYTVGMQIRGCGLSNMNGAKSRKEREV